MPRGGFRVGAGGYRPNAGRRRKRAMGTSPEPDPNLDTSGDARSEQVKFSPLDYLLSVINDPEASPERRDRAAIAAAPYSHARFEAAGAGKRQRLQSAAEAAAAGKFAPPSPPKLSVVG